MQLHLVIQQNPLLNNANLKEKKKKTICHVRVSKLEKQQVLVLSSNETSRWQYLSSCQWQPVH